MDGLKRPLASIVEHRYADLAEIRLHYVVAGEGNAEPLVLLLHGFPEFWYSWRAQIPALAAAGYRVVAPDLRGYNTSDKPPRARDYRVEALARDVRQLVEHLGEERALVVGHDWGAAVAWMVAMLHPEVVERFAILNLPHPVRLLRGLPDPRQLLRSWYMFFFQLPALPELLLRAGDYYIPRRLFERDPINPAAFDELDLQRYRAALAKPGALTASINYYRALFRRNPLSLMRSLRTISAPTLVVWGLRDRFLRSELVAPDPEWVPDCRVQRLEASHWVQLDAPERVNRLLLEFFAERGKSPA